MEYNKRISAIAPGDEVEGYYILKAANPKVAANGKPFLTGALSDKTGTIELKVWDYPGPLGTGDEGKVVKVRGTAGEYRGTVQFTAGRIRLAAEDDPVDVAALVPTAPIDRTAAMDELRRWAASIEDGDYRAVAEEMLDAHGEALAAIPAAKSVHHAFLGGLLMHTANMMKIADFLAGMYPATIDRSLLLCGTLLPEKAVGGMCGALLTNVSAWLSGIWFSLDLGGKVFRRIAYALPFANAVDAARAALAGDWGGMFPQLWIVLAWAFGLLTAAIVIFRRKMTAR